MTEYETVDDETRDRLIEEFSHFIPAKFEDTELLYRYWTLGPESIDSAIDDLGLKGKITTDELLGGDTMDFPEGRMILRRLRIYAGE